MALSFVEAGSESCRARAATYAQEFAVPLVWRGEVAPVTDGIKLIVDHTGITLGFVDSKRGKPLALDFSSSATRALFAKPLPKSHIFRRALGLGETLIDATAGLGQDSILACACGFTVTAIERSPVVAVVLRHAVERACREDSEMAEKLKSFSVVRADARIYLKDLNPASTDVVYIDPMFSKPKHSAKSPKNMQILQDLLGPDPDGEDALLEAAGKVARRRVVIKRPLKARASSAPSFSLKGQSVRYDVYA